MATHVLTRCPVPTSVVGVLRTGLPVVAPLTVRASAVVMAVHVPVAFAITVLAMRPPNAVAAVHMSIALAIAILWAAMPPLSIHMSIAVPVAIANVVSIITCRYGTIWPLRQCHPGYHGKQQGNDR